MACLFVATKSTRKRSIRRELLPLDGGRRLGGDIVDATVDTLHLVDDTVGNTSQQVVGEAIPVGSHVISRLHTTNGSRLDVNRN